MQLDSGSDSTTKVASWRNGSWARARPGSAATRTLARLLERPGIAVAAAVFDSAGRLVDTAAAGAETPLVIGRHSNVDLQLRDEGIALRHLVLLATEHEGRLRTRIWDLRTGLGFTVQDGAQATAAIAQGDFEVGFGPYTLLVRSREQVRALPQVVARQPPGVEVTRVEPIRYLGERRAAEAQIAELEVRSDRCSQLLNLPLSSDDLEGGVLIGRYARCAVQAETLDSLSRVHALIVEIDHEPWVIDLASTNGTTKNGVPVSAARFGRGDLLGCSSLGLRWVD